MEIGNFDRQAYLGTLDMIKSFQLNTVCMEANCPNRYECFSNNTATFMLLGNSCTRDCKYCNIDHSSPHNIDPGEPKRIASAVDRMNLKYVVLTSVTRDDLPDGGASQFVKTVQEIRKQNNCRIELLIPDLNGNPQALKQILQQKPDVLNHNIEVVKDLFPKLRPQGNYDMSLSLLKQTTMLDPNIITKSGLMVGLGETMPQIIETMKDLRDAGCKVLTIGQYLQPSSDHAPVQKMYSDLEFSELRQTAFKLGFNHVEASSLTRSSYHADNSFDKCS